MDENMKLTKLKLNTNARIFKKCIIYSFEWWIPSLTTVLQYSSTIIVYVLYWILGDYLLIIVN